MAPRRSVAAATALLTGAAGLALAVPGAEATAHPSARKATSVGSPAARYTRRSATAVGRGGAVTSVDLEASKVGLGVLRRGGNAVDAAVATAAALGVTEPYSAGIGGGGYFVVYNARTGKVGTIDGRETAPQTMPRNAFVDPSTGEPYPFTPQLVTSGVSVGTPGTLATWQRALRRWGTRSLARSLEPAARLAERGFVVDRTFNLQTSENAERFSQFPATSRLFLPGGKPRAVGSVFRNRDLARTYRLIARKGTRTFYRGALARQIVRIVRHPAERANATLPIPPGYLSTRDLRRYTARRQAPTHTRYRGLDVYGMAPSSSGGTTVGEALNILERSNLEALPRVQSLHRYLEASALAFADRNEYVGDSRYVRVPVGALLSDTYAAERACQIDPTRAATKPVAAGNVRSYDGRCSSGDTVGRSRPDTENRHTTNLTVADRWGNVVEYTLTIEQTGGSGMVVPGRGFLLNNELTDFSYADGYDPSDPNRIQGGKRPRSSMSPTILLRGGKPFLAVGSPGGATIITTVLQVLVNRIDFTTTLPQAVAAPRASQQNKASVTAEQSFIDQYGPGLGALGHTFTPAGDPGTSAAEIGAATGIELGRGGQLTAVSEPVRRGGGSALVVRPSR